MSTPVDERERERRRHRALADPSRARILAELTADGPLDTRQLATRVGLHANTVRVHLGALADAGLVTAETVASHGRGRPRLAYRATGAAPDDGVRRYRLLAEILTTLVARSGGDSVERLVETAEAWGRHLVESPPPLASLTDAEALERLLALLAEIGFEPVLEPRGGRRRRGVVRMRPCPFLELARRHQDVVCPIHLGLMRGALAELGAAATTATLDPFVRPDLCVAELAPAASA